MIKYGNIKIDIPLAQLENIRFEDYFTCYTQYEKLERYYTEHNSSIWQKTAPTTSADTNLYPIKSYNTTNLRGETQAEVEEMVPAFRNRIISEGVGT